MKLLINRHFAVLLGEAITRYKYSFTCRVSKAVFRAKILNVRDVPQRKNKAKFA
jgi:hypothetical protein